MKKRLVAILLLVGCIPLLLSFAYFYNMVYDQVIAKNEADNQAAVTAVQVDARYFLETKMGVMKLLAQNPAIYSLNLEAGRPLIVAAGKLHPEMNIVVDDTKGMQAFRADNLELVGVGSRQFYKDALAGKEPISDVLSNLNTGKPVVILAAPVRDGQTITGVIQGSLQLTVLDNFLKQRANSSRQLFIIDSTGKLMAHSDPAIGAERKDMSKIAFVQEGLQQGKGGTATVVNDSGTKTVVYYVRDEVTGWLICSETTYDAIMAPINSLRIKFAVGFTVMIALIGSLGWMLANRVAKPINLLTEQARQVAGGNLSVPALTLNTNDEIEDLAKAFEVMVQYLRELIQRLSHEAEQLSASSEELTATSDQSAQTINMMATSIAEVASGADKQVEAVNAIAAVARQMSGGIQQMADAAASAAGASDNTAGAARDGTSSIGRAVAQMNNIETTVTSSAAIVTKLGERSKEIGQIVDAIANIAGQTNLLALNAAIEAARAGEQGRGFAVVAEEVRKLAEQSEEAAKQIASLIAEIQGQTDQAVLGMNAGTLEVKKGAEVVAAAGQTFSQIVELINHVSVQVGDMSTGMRQMAADSQQIVARVREIETISKDTATRSQDVSTASAEQSASLEEIAAASQGLGKMAQDLQTVIGKFRV